MIDLGPHAGFIELSYAAAFLAIAGLIVWVAMDERSARIKLENLERRGLRRRSSPQSNKDAV